MQWRVVKHIVSDAKAETPLGRQLFDDRVSDAVNEIDVEKLFAQNVGMHKQLVLVKGPMHEIHGGGTDVTTVEPLLIYGENLRVIFWQQYGSFFRPLPVSAQCKAYKLRAGRDDAFMDDEVLRLLAANARGDYGIAKSVYGDQ